MNIKTLSLTQENYELIITTIQSGFTAIDGTVCKPNSRIATALVTQANLGTRISDIVKLSINSFVRDGNRYRLDITEQKTKKKREFTVPDEVYNYLVGYALDNNVNKAARLFPLTERAIQKHLKLTCEYLGLEGVGTHSFRKFFATNLYNDNGYNIELVRTVLQHTTAATTQRYIGIQQKDVEDALKRNVNLL